MSEIDGALGEKTIGDDILEAQGSTDVLEEVLQSVTAQALRMGRVEDGVSDLRGSVHALQQSVEQLGMKEAAPAPDGHTNNALLEHIDEVDQAAKRASRRSGWVLFLVVLQMVLIGGLFGQSYLNQYSPPPPPPVAKAEPIKAPEPTPAPAPVAVAPEPAPAPLPEATTPEKGRHGKSHHKK